MITTTLKWASLTIRASLLFTSYKPLLDLLTGERGSTAVLQEKHRARQSSHCADTVSVKRPDMSAKLLFVGRDRQ